MAVRPLVAMTGLLIATTCPAGPRSGAAGSCQAPAHATAHAACLSFETVDEDEGLDDCKRIQSGDLPDGNGRYEVRARSWSDTRQAELLILEQEGCSTLVGPLGWNTMAEVSTQVRSITPHRHDMDGDGIEEITFYVEEREEDASGEDIVERQIKSRRICRSERGRWSCGEQEPRP